MVISRAKSVEDTMAKAEEDLAVSQEALLRRLRRIEGQVRGIEKMIVDDRDCVSIVIQLAAVRSGIEGIGALVLNNCMKLCFQKGAAATTDIDSLSRAVAIWGRVRGEDVTSEVERTPREKRNRAARSGNM
jgi:DNA-binding FrmR family transcriptional regulator